MFKYIFERKWTFCKSRNVCGCSKALILFKDYRLFCVVQCSLTFVADEPGANRKLHKGLCWRWYWRQCNDDGDCDAVQNAVDDVDDEKNWKDKTFKDTQYKMQQTKNIGKK